MRLLLGAVEDPLMQYYMRDPVGTLQRVGLVVLVVGLVALVVVWFLQRR